MRFVVLLGIYLIAAVVLAAPAKKKQPSACTRKCGDEYENDKFICAKSKEDKKDLMVFPNNCSFDKYHCLNKNKLPAYEVTSLDDCHGGIKLFFEYYED